MKKGRVHSYLSREIFIPWVINGFRKSGWRQYHAELKKARAGIEQWAQSDRVSRSAWVQKELRSMVLWAGQNVPYYRRLFTEIGFDPREEFSFADYQRIPVLDRETIRNNVEDFFADGFGPEQMKRKPTGGSTGEPLWVWIDGKSRAWSDAAQDWAFSRVGYRPGDRLGLIWGASADPRLARNRKAKIGDWLAHIQVNECFRLSHSVLDDIHKRLSAYQPEFLRCYPASLALLARRLLERNIRPAYPRVGIITGAEKLHHEQRSIINDAFSIPVFESYGSRECGLLAMQFSVEEPRLHIVGTNTFLEPFGKADAVSGNEVLVTLLHRWGMPLLRYRIGDRARFAETSDGGPSEVLEEVTGRVLDLIHLPGGRMVHSCQFPGLFKNLDIREYQVVQEADGKIRVSLIPGSELTSEDIARIERVLRDNLIGVACAVSLTSTIDRTVAGKLRPVVSHYRPETLVA